MFTNFLFFDDIGGNFSGLCDQYYLSRQPPASQNETALQYERPVYGAWKDFGKGYGFGFPLGFFR